MVNSNVNKLELRFFPVGFEPHPSQTKPPAFFEYLPALCPTRDRPGLF
jgi:hypothetical protein